MPGKKIVLTSDRTMMSSYHGGVLLGFASIVPVKVLPDPIFNHLFCPPVDAAANGSALLAPCGMRKVEAALLESGFQRDEVMVAHPDHLDMAIGPETEVVGITHDDPLGKIARLEVEEMIRKGPPHNRSKFLALINHPLIKEHKPKVVVGGNGAWELVGEEVASAVDHIYMGEGESDFPRICRSILAKKELPRVIHGTAVPGEDIPVNRGATIGGIVEIGRGCWRGCSFCSPSMRKMRYRPLQKILDDVKINQSLGQRDVLLHAEDVFTYGSKSMEINEKMILDLFAKVKELSPRTIDVSHLSLANVYHHQELLREISSIVGVGSDQSHMSAWVGIETGSCDVLKRHMPKKALPADPENWTQIVQDSYRLFEEESWLPVASLVLGLPGEMPEDVVKTIELVESLKDYTGLMLPLFHTPMSQTRLGAVRGMGKDGALPEHWELVGLCLEYNLRHMHALHQFYKERMTAGWSVHAALYGLNLVADRVLNKYMNRMKQGLPPA